MAGLRRGDWRSYIADAAAKRPSLLRAARGDRECPRSTGAANGSIARVLRYLLLGRGNDFSANLLAAAAAEEISAEVITAFEDPALEALLGIDGEARGHGGGWFALGRTDEPAAPSAQVEPLTPETIPAFVERGRVS